MCHAVFLLFFFFNDTATTEIYTLSLHDALPIAPPQDQHLGPQGERALGEVRWRDRKSTRLNSSHSQNSYAVFCLKKKNNNQTTSNQKKKNQKNKTTTHQQQLT